MSRTFPRPDYAALTRYDPGRTPVGIDLSDNTNLWGAPPAALAVLHSAQPADLARYPTLYADALREGVANRFGVPIECVTTGVGSDDVLDSTWRAACLPGGRVAFMAPTFSMIQPFCLMNGLEPRPVPWAEAAERPSRLVEEAPSLIYVCRPNNPTGALLPEPWIDELLDARGPDGPLVVVDEAYVDFAGESWLDRATSEPNLLVARTFSKAYGLAGLRCGFAVSRPEVIEAVDKSRGPYKLPGLVGRAAAAALADEDGWVRSTVEASVASRSRLETALGELGVRYLPSAANFVAVAAPTGDARAASDALRKAGVGVRPFAGLPEIGQALRVTVGPEPMMNAFLTAFREVLS